MATVVLALSEMEEMPGIIASSVVDTLEWHTVTVNDGDGPPFYSDCKKKRYDDEGFPAMPPYGFECQECRLQRMWIDG